MTDGTTINRARVRATRVGKNAKIASKSPQLLLQLLRTTLSFFPAKLVLRIPALNRKANSPASPLASVAIRAPVSSVPSAAAETVTIAAAVVAVPIAAVIAAAAVVGVSNAVDPAELANMVMAITAIMARAVLNSSAKC